MAPRQVRRQILSPVGLSLFPQGVRLVTPYRLSSIGCVLTHNNNNVVKSANPTHGLVDADREWVMERVSAISQSVKEQWGKWEEEAA